MAKKVAKQVSFDDQLVLYCYFLHELKLDSLSSLSEKLNSTEFEGTNESGNTYFYDYISSICKMRGAAISVEKLRLYDENICRHTHQLSEKRGAFHWKYFQYVALLFTEMYLDKYFSNAATFCDELNAWLLLHESDHAHEHPSVSALLQTCQAPEQQTVHQQNHCACP